MGKERKKKISSPEKLNLSSNTTTEEGTFSFLLQRRMSASQLTRRKRGGGGVGGPLILISGGGGKGAIRSFYPCERRSFFWLEKVEGHLSFGPEERREGKGDGN